jgi:acetylornithine deacetylase/succinyl-diaminopimelate desuccinylase-like protein
VSPTSRAPTFENALAFAQDLIRIPGLPGDEEAVARRVFREMETLGFRDVRIDDAGSVIGVVRGRGEAPPALLNCHLDVVAEGVRAAAAAVGGRPDAAVPARVRPWTFATDGGWSCGVHGIPTVGFAPGEERHAHTNRERLGLEEARWAFGRYPKLIAAVQRAAGGS